MMKNLGMLVSLIGVVLMVASAMQFGVLVQSITYNITLGEISTHQGRNLLNAALGFACGMTALSAGSIMLLISLSGHSSSRHQIANAVEEG